MNHTAFISTLQWDDLPEAVQPQAKRCLKDIIATAAGSTALPGNDGIVDLVKSQFQAGPAPLFFRGASVAATGAAYANAQTVDSLDCHDGYRPNKGHCGATVVPVAVGAAAEADATGADLLAAVVVGYEIASRAGTAVHEIYAPHFHASGSWVAVGAAAAGARLLGTPPDDVDSCLGMAEYYAPIAPMLRCTEHPSVVKDAAGPGAWAAATALELSRRELPGLPSLFAATDAGRRGAATLGEDWLILRQYFKPYPTCRWTQPAVEGVLGLKRRHGFSPEEIEAIRVTSFETALHIMSFPPTHSDGAQYSLPWAVAAAAVDGTLGVDQIHPSRFDDPRILALGKKVGVVVAEDLDARFPEECLARVEIRLNDGSTFTTGTMAARGDYTEPLPESEIDEKFRTLVQHARGEAETEELLAVIDTLDQRPASDLLKRLT